MIVLSSDLFITLVDEFLCTFINIYFSIVSVLEITRCLVQVVRGLVERARRGASVGGHSSLRIILFHDTFQYIRCELVSHFLILTQLKLCPKLIWLHSITFPKDLSNISVSII